MPGKTAIDDAAVFQRIVSEGPGAQLSRGEAAAVIAARLPSEGNVRGMRNRVAMRLDAALKRGRDETGCGLVSLEDGNFTADEIGRWAKRTFGPLFADFPTKSRTVYDSAEVTVIASATCSKDVLPGNIDRCHELIQELRLELRSMKEQQVRKEEERKQELISRLHRN
ncbi:MAG: hypothetical protein WBP11_06020 [Dokdonella sp.]